MSRVKKNILNGWKEIGAYVSRDIRTVERWEKARGLPVRRIPGAGRATVYAVISEVDEWMSSTLLDDDLTGPLETERTAPEQSADEPELEATTSSETAEQSTAQAIDAQASAVDGTDSKASSETGKLNQSEMRVARWDAPLQDIAALGTARRNLIRLVSLAAVLVVMAVSLNAFRPMLAHPRQGDAGASAVSPARTSSSPFPYSSRVPGVDDLCLNGVYSYEQRTPVALEHSMDDFKAAIAKDPGFAPAYAGMANTYILLREYSHMSDTESFEGARSSAQRALALDPKLAQAHTALGFVEFFWDWKPQQAEREFRTAIELEPSLGLAHHWYGSMLAHQGRFDEAIQQLDLAQRLDPSSAAIVSIKALALGMSGRRNDAVRLLEDILEHAPSASSPHRVLSTLSLIEPRDLNGYLRESLRVAQLRNNREQQTVLETAQRALQAGGETAMWQSILASEQKMHPSPGQHTYEMAEAEAALGRYDIAFEDLNRLVERHDSAITGILLEPFLFPMRHDPRMQTILSRTVTRSDAASLPAL